MNFTHEELLNFIHEASHNTYASEDESLRKKQEDGSTTIEYTSDDWHYNDNYFGGEPYGGREVVFYKGKAIWMMVYYGWVEKGASTKEVYPMLAEALRKSSPDLPYRGPKEYVNGDLKYVNTVDGTVENFIGEEFILKNEAIIFQTSYCGGLIDK